LARFLRSYGVSKLRPPAVVDAAITFRPVEVKTTTRPTQYLIARSRLGEPLYVPVLVFRPVAVKTAPQPQQYRVVRSELRPPSAVDPAITFRPVETKTVQRPPQYRFSRSKLGAPILAPAPTPVLVPLEVRLARFRPISTASAILRPPPVVGAPIVFDPVRLHLTQPPVASRRAKSALRPPATLVAAVVAQVFAPILVRLTRARAVLPVESKLRPPTVVAPAVVFRAVQVKLARLVGTVPGTHSRLFPIPPFAPYIAPPIRRALARSYRKVQAQSKLRKPTVVGAAVTFRPLVAKLVRRPRQAGAARSIVRAPVVVFDAFVAPVLGYFRNHPRGVTDSTADEGEFGNDPAGQSGSGPDEAGFDR